MCFQNIFILSDTYICEVLILPMDWDLLYAAHSSGIREAGAEDTLKAALNGGFNVNIVCSVMVDRSDGWC